ncbi:MAG TPA: AAA family ATPase, partial [Chloroflexota bacterium]|nr:AAA family ATPase [Chloroflexota bacterium]
PNLEIQAVAEQLQAATHHRVAAPTRQASDARSLLEPPLVGRAPELMTLRGRFAQAQQGQAQVVVLAGETGIGKTRLASEFLTAIESQGADVLRGQAFEQHDSVPYTALVEALRPRLERENAPDDLLGDLWLAALSGVLPELCERYPDLTASATDRTEARLFEAVVRLIRALADRQPLVLFLDDAQWVDGATRELVHYAVRRWAQHGIRLLVLLAVRIEDVGTNPELATWLEQLGRSAPTTRLTLGPLTPSATTRLVAALAGTELPGAQPNAGESAETRFGAWLAAETGGQPFFIMETLRALLEEGALALRPNAAGGCALDVRVALRDPERLHNVVPARVQEVIRTQLGRLSQNALALLMAGAALGSHFTFEQLCHIAEMPEQDALEGLDEAVRAYLLCEDAMGWYTFCYDTLRAVVCVQAGAARRQVFWRRAQALPNDRSNVAPWRDQDAVAGVGSTSASQDEAAGNLVHAGYRAARIALGLPSIRIVAAPILAQ